MARIFTRTAIAMVAVWAAAVHASPEEIQVYLDELTPPGRVGADLHNNFVFSGSTEPDYPGAQPPAHVYRFTPEFYYGYSEAVELGLYLLTTTADSPNFDGAKLRIKYVAPHDELQGPFWGLNLEAGHTSLRVSESRWNTEFKGIWGDRSGPWLVALNLNLDSSLSSPGAGKTFLDIDSKLAYRLAQNWQAGLESYDELGPLRDPGRLSRQSHTLYAVADTAIAGVDLNAGVGRGLTPASDRWIAKFIVGLKY